MPGRILCVPNPYPSLQDALNYVSTDDCITISSGVYEIPPNTHIGLTKSGVHILADDDGGSGPQLVFAPGSCFFVTAAECRLQGLKFRGPAVPPLPLVTLTCSELCMLENVTVEITSDEGVGVFVSADSKVVISDLTVVGVDKPGKKDTKGLVFGNRVYGRVQSARFAFLEYGMVMNPLSDGLLSNASISKCSTGLVISEGCTPRVEYVIAEDIRDTGVMINLGKSVSNPVILTACKFQRCGAGIKCSLPGKLEIFRNMFESNNVGIESTQEATPIIRNNAFNENKTALKVETGSDPEILENVIDLLPRNSKAVLDVERYGVCMSDLGTTAHLSGNEITGIGVGMKISQHANPIIDGNSFQGCTCSVLVETEGHARLRNNTIRSNIGKAAIEVFEKGVAVMEYCEVTQCQGSAMIVHDKGSCQVISNKIASCNMSAFVFEGTAEAYIRKNELREMPQGWIYFSVGASKDGVQYDGNIVEDDSLKLVT